MPRVRDLMTEEVSLTTLNTPVNDAARLMRKSDSDCLIVFDLGRPTGILTERDIIRKVAAEGLEARRVHVADIVSSPLITIHPDKPAREAASLMLEKKIRHLPVVKGNNLLGMITLRDFLKEMSDEAKEEAIQSTKKGGHQVAVLRRG